MKTIALGIFFALTISAVSAQSQAEAFIKEAQQYLVEKNYKQAQLSLQDAINDINNIIAVHIGEAVLIRKSVPVNFRFH